MYCLANREDGRDLKYLHIGVSEDLSYATLRGRSYQALNRIAPSEGTESVFKRVLFSIVHRVKSPVKTGK